MHPYCNANSPEVHIRVPELFTVPPAKVFVSLLSNLITPPVLTNISPLLLILPLQNLNVPYRVKSVPVPFSRVKTALVLFKDNFPPDSTTI